MDVPLRPNETVSAAARAAAAELCRRIAASVACAVTGQAATVRLLLAAFVTRGHVLLEDVPGTGKTTLAKALAASVGLRFNRIQCTPDLLPADILGVSVFNPQTRRFEVHEGPLFTDILLADEINRASPRTQSALLEAMAEAQVSLDGTTYPLSAHFFVIATQNPLGFEGTYPLPESQLDRFAIRLSLGYLALEDEVSMVRAQQSGPPLAELAPCAEPAVLAGLARAARSVHVDEAILRYVVALVAATRAAEDVALGASPRASITLVRLAQALALFDGLDFVTPDRVRELALPVLGHRLSLLPAARYGGLHAETVIARVLDAVPVPR